LHSALNYDETCLTVTDIEWGQFASVFTAARRSPLITTIPEATPKRVASEAVAEEAGKRELLVRLSTLSEDDQRQVLTDLVSAHAADVLGYGAGDPLDPHSAFKDLGFDSMMATELSGQLKAVTGLRMPPTLVYDYPSPAALAAHLRTVVTKQDAPSMTDIETAIMSSITDAESRKRTMSVLRTITRKLEGESATIDLKDVADDDMFDLLGEEFGISYVESTRNDQMSGDREGKA
jgi:acyl carrier protein